MIANITIDIDGEEAELEVHFNHEPADPSVGQDAYLDIYKIYEVTPLGLAGFDWHPLRSPYQQIVGACWDWLAEQEAEADFEKASEDYEDYN